MSEGLTHRLNCRPRCSSASSSPSCPSSSSGCRATTSMRTETGSKCPVSVTHDDELMTLQGQPNQTHPVLEFSGPVSLQREITHNLKFQPDQGVRVHHAHLQRVHLIGTLRPVPILLCDAGPPEAVRPGPEVLHRQVGHLPLLLAK